MGGLTVAFGLGLGTASGTFSAVTDNGDGTYSAVFTVAAAGTNTVSATISGALVTSAEPSVTVTPGPVSLTQSEVAIVSSTLQAGSTTAVTLTTLDDSDNQEPGRRPASDVYARQRYGQRHVRRRPRQRRRHLHRAFHGDDRRQQYDPGQHQRPSRGHDRRDCSYPGAG